MNILVIAHYQNDGSLCANYVQPQIEEYQKKGNNVKVIVPVPFFKSDFSKRKVSHIIQKTCVKNVEYCFVRYLSLSNFGKKADLNTKLFCVQAKLFYKKIMGDFIPDVIHSHTIGFESEIGFKLKKRMKCPLVVTMHGTDVSVLIDNLKIKKMSKYLEHVDCPVCVSSSLQKKVAKFCGIESAVILNGFENNEFDTSFDMKNKNTNQIITVCNLIPQKRVHVTIEAFNKVHQLFPSLKLIVAGDGPEKNRLTELVKSLKLDESVVFLGKVQHQVVLEKMKESSVFVMPSSPEGFGIVYLEAMSCGCLTIGTEGEGISDLIEHGKNGFLVPVDDSDAISNVIIPFLNNAAAFSSIVARGMESVQELTWCNNADKYLAIFKLLQKKEGFK